MTSRKPREEIEPDWKSKQRFEQAERVRQESVKRMAEKAEEDESQTKLGVFI